MKKTILITALLAVLASLLSCNNDLTQERAAKAYTGEKAPNNLPDIEFVKVPTSLFTFNETPAGRLVEGTGKSVETIQHTFWISKEPVPASFYETYMGKGKYPKNGLSYEEINKLLDKAYLSTGLPLILPSEAMFEAAMQNETISPSEAYCIIVADGWNDIPSQKEPAINLQSPITNSNIVSRNRYKREPVEKYRARSINRFYVAMHTPKNDDPVDTILDKITYADTEPSDGKKETFTVNGVTFSMMPIKGGSLTLGATFEQEKYAELDEGPAHAVVLNDFKIGQTEVTAELWNAVMGYYPIGNFKTYPKQPVTNVSWYDAQEFILKLREATGHMFRLPTEDEWEYAARGGQYSKGTIFAGSNQSAEVAVCTYKDRKGESVRPRPANVATKKPNELGLYDMSGNAWEWVHGLHPDGGYILRGGSRLSLNTACRVSNRQSTDAGAKKDTFGFRLVL